IVVAPGRAAAEPQSGPTVDGLPTTATLELLGRERAILRDGAAASGAAASGAAAPGAAAPGGDRHRVLLPAPDPGPGIGGHEGADRREVVVDGWRIEVEIRSASRAALGDLARRGREETGHSGPTQVHAIIPGVVVSVSVAPGDMVTAGQQLLVVEAMKMQNELRSPRDGTIERVAVGMGARIDAGDLLLVLA
ncbi:MAG TPA: biotin/lipoyl-containing protein, partial [Candidatus Binatus sp.]|nr:biotin/lipoyl-containing protein [Candidatus Binatus sp.]